MTFLMVFFFAAVGVATLLTPHRLRAIALTYSDRVTGLPFNYRGWVESRYYVPTLRLIGIACLLAAGFLYWLSIDRPA